MTRTWKQKKCRAGLMMLTTASGVMVRASDLQSRNSRFVSRLLHCHVTTLGELFARTRTYMYNALVTKQFLVWYWPKSLMFYSCEGNREPDEK